MLPKNLNIADKFHKLKWTYYECSSTLGYHTSGIPGTRPLFWPIQAGFPKIGHIVLAH